MTARTSVPPATLAQRLFGPVDNRSLAFFRIYFAAMMLWTLWDDFFAGNRIAYLFIDPPFHFTYFGFSWVKPWPGVGMYVHFSVLVVAAICVLVGFLYRLSALLLAVGFTYVFLLERAIYLNHYYLMCLLCFVLAVVPAHQAWSVDAWLRPSLRSGATYAWTVWLVRFHVALPYVFGGIAKLNADWLQGQPMQLWLSKSVWRVMLGPVAEQHWFALAFSWGGLLFDLSIVPLLLYRRTRTIAFCVAVAFHLMNGFMLNIGIFPWLMIGATAIFFDPDWPSRVITPPPDAPVKPKPAPLSVPALSHRTQTIIRWALGLYVFVHVLLPFRPWVYPGNPSWTEEGSMFTWRMMLRDKKTLLNFAVADIASKKAEPVELTKWLSKVQGESMGEDPEMMREFAVFLREEYETQGRDVSVHVMALTSLNGRWPQPLMDRSVDLSREPRILGHPKYVIPLGQPLRWPPLNVPVNEWPELLMK